MKETAVSINEAFCAANPRSWELFERGRGCMAGAAKGAYYHKPFPLTMERGGGCYLYDVDGHRYLDFANHHTVQILGHNHPAVMKAVQAQMGLGIALGAGVGIEANLCAEMCRRVNSVQRIRFCNSGTEATLHAIRLARGFSGRPKIAKFEGGYHGSHDAVEISVSPHLDNAGPETHPHSVPATGGMSAHAAHEVVVLPYDDEEAVERLVVQHRDELACVILDPKAGILVQRKEFVQAVRDITRKNDVLLILDEVVAFRVAHGGYQETMEISPDLTTFGKCVGGGFPVGAFGGRADIMDLLDNTGKHTGFQQSGTFSANPITMTAGLATLEQLTLEAFEHLHTLGNRLQTGLNSLFTRKHVSARAIGSGSLFSIYFTDSEVTSYRSVVCADSDFAHQVFLDLLNQGYHLGCGLVMCSLSLPMASSHVDDLVEAVGRAIERAQE